MTDNNDTNTENQETQPPAEEKIGRLEAWLTATGNQDGQDWLRSEFERMVVAIDLMHQSLAQISQDLSEKSNEFDEAYTDNQFYYGYLAGKARQAQLVNVIIGQLLNQLINRAIK